jgi:hypothetical protein
MKRRSTVSGKPAKVKRPKASKSKRVPPPREASRPTSSAAGKEGEVARLTGELNEAREQQTATSEVLAVINSSSGELERVFQSMLENATRICDARFGMVFRFDNGEFVLAAEVGTPVSICQPRQAARPVQANSGKSPSSRHADKESEPHR